MSDFILMNTTSEAEGIFTSRHDVNHSAPTKEAFIEIFESHTSSKLSDEEKDEIWVSHNSASLKLEDEDGEVNELFSLELI